MAPLDRIEPIRDREARVAARKETSTVKVRMITEHRMSPDGVQVVALHDGQEYELAQATAGRLIERGVAVEAKAEGPAPANKAEGPAPENKAARSRRRGTTT